MPTLDRAAKVADLHELAGFLGLFERVGGTGPSGPTLTATTETPIATSSTSCRRTGPSR